MEEIPNEVCAYCGKVLNGFKVWSNSQKYCSGKCMLKAIRQDGKNTIIKNEAIKNEVIKPSKGGIDDTIDRQVCRK